MKRKTQDTADVVESSVVVDSKASVAEIPAFADKILKAYPQYDEMYVDSHGGAFTKDAQPNLVENAILFKNPYYQQ